MRLLITTGGSPHSETALRLATHLLHERPIAEKPTILTVIKQEADRSQANIILAQAGELWEPRVSGVQTKVRIGRRAEEIIREAQEGHYDLVIMGKRPAHRLITRFLGSTATRVMEKAPCPVIIVKGEPAPVHRILLCDSGAQSPSLLSRFSRELAELFAGEMEIIVLHVMSQISAGPGVTGKQLRASADELIQEHAPEGELLVQDIQTLQRANVQAYAKVRHGLVVDEILEEARSGDYDLVVIGTYRREGWWRFLLENLARQIIAQIDRPVLVLR